MRSKVFQEALGCLDEENPMIEIDGSQGEGGGQLLRSALAFSALSGHAFAIHRIRANRAKPGLRPQHLAAVHLAAQLCAARVDGDAVDSNRLLFFPGSLRPGYYRQEIGTAGSLVLLTQASLIPALRAGGEVVLDLLGGTDVPMAPSLDYLLQVVLPYYRRLGEIEIEVSRRGFHPVGGGRVRLTLRGFQDAASPLLLRGPTGWRERARRAVVSQRLEQARVAERLLASAAPEETTESLYVSSDSPGAVLTMWAHDGGERWSGVSALGRPGLPAEQMAHKAEAAFAAQLADSRPVEEYLADQLVPLLTLLGGQMECQTISEHCSTNMAICSLFTSTRFQVEETTITATRDEAEEP